MAAPFVEPGERRLADIRTEWPSPPRSNLEANSTGTCDPHFVAVASR